MGKLKKLNDIILSKRDSMKWTEAMDNAFLDALLLQESLGNRAEKIFTTVAYRNMVNDLHETFGVAIEKGHLKNRIKTLRHNFRECHLLFRGRSGFVWNSQTKMWNASPASWNALLKERPDAGKWVTTRIPNYDKLVVLFGNERMESDAVKEEGRPDSSDVLFNGISLNDDGIPLNDLVNVAMLDYGMNDNGSQIDSQGRSPSTTTSSRGKKRKPPKIDLLEREFRGIRDAVKEVAEAIREANVVAEKGRVRVYLEHEVFAELVRLGVETEVRFKAYSFLIADSGRVRAFFGCPVEERKAFLMYMMGGSDDPREGSLG